MSWIDHTKNEVLRGVKEERNILSAVKRRKANWVGHVLRRSCLLKYVVERKIVGKGKRGRRLKQLRSDLCDKRRNWNFQEEALDRIVWRTCCGRIYGNIASQTARFIMMIYLLTAIGLSPGGRSTVYIYTQTIHRTIQNTQYIEQHNNFGRVRAVPRLG